MKKKKTTGQFSRSYISLLISELLEIQLIRMLYKDIRGVIDNENGSVIVGDGPLVPYKNIHVRRRGRDILVESFFPPLVLAGRKFPPSLRLPAGIVPPLSLNPDESSFSLSLSWREGKKNTHTQRPSFFSPLVSTCFYYYINGGKYQSLELLLRRILSIPSPKNAFLKKNSKVGSAMTKFSLKASCCCCALLCVRNFFFSLAPSILQDYLRGLEQEQRWADQ